MSLFGAVVAGATLAVPAAGAPLGITGPAVPPPPAGQRRLRPKRPALLGQRLDLPRLPGAQPAQRRDPLAAPRRQRAARVRERAPEPLRPRPRAGHGSPLCVGQRAGRARKRERSRAGRDSVRRPAWRVLWLASLLAERENAAAERPVRRRDSAGRLPRAARLRRRDRVLHRPLVPARLPREPLRRRVGRIPPRPL